MRRRNLIISEEKMHKAPDHRIAFLASRSVDEYIAERKCISDVLSVLIERLFRILHN
jgi:hypothetical protein